jgi:hypothetical protein
MPIENKCTDGVECKLSTTQTRMSYNDLHAKIGHDLSIDLATTFAVVYFTSFIYRAFHPRIISRD